MRPLRNGDLIPVNDAAELIDSAQDAAKILAQRCAEKDAEIARLREAIAEWRSAWTGVHCGDREAFQRYEAAVYALLKIAREGR